MPTAASAIAGEEGQPWCEAARQLAAEADLPLDAVRIGHLDGDLYDPRCTWLRQRRRGPGPPGPLHRLAPSGRDRRPRAALAAALSQILGRPVGMPSASAV